MFVLLREHRLTKILRKFPHSFIDQRMTNDPHFLMDWFSDLVTFRANKKLLTHLLAHVIMNYA